MDSEARALLWRRLYERRGMLLEQTAAEEDLSAPGLSMTAGSKSVFISVNQCHRWFYNSYKGLGSL